MVAQCGDTPDFHFLSAGLNIILWYHSVGSGEGDDQRGKATAMPKRKAPEPADDVAVGVCDKLMTSSPNPHKKSKTEALAAAREWHDGRAKSGVVAVGGASPSAGKAGAGDGKISDVQQLPAASARSDEEECAVAATSAAAATTHAAAAEKGKKEALAAAREWHDGRAKSGVVAVVGDASPAVAKARAGVGKIAAVQQRSATSAQKECASAATSAASAGKIPENVVSTQPPLYRDEKPTKSDGGPGGGNNAFLKSVRTEKGTALKSKKDESSSKSTNTESPPLTAPSISGSTNLSSRFAPDRTDATTKKYIGIFGRSLLFLSLFALNISMAIVSIVVINGLSSSIDALRERHVSEVEELATRVSKSREVEALLRSGIRVLEREATQAERTDDPADASAVYGIRTEDTRIDARVDPPQSLEEKDDWLQGMRALEAEKRRGLESLNAKIITLSGAGRVWSEEDGAN